LRDEDYVISMAIISAEYIRENDEEAGDLPNLLAISENGYGKRSPISAYPVNVHRGGKGVITMNTSARNGKMAALMLVTDEDDLMIITKEGMIIRQAVKDVKITQGRNTQGVRLINLNKGDQVCDITCVPPENEDEDNLDKKVEELKKVPPRSQLPVNEEIDDEFTDEDDELEIETADDADDDTDE